MPIFIIFSPWVSDTVIFVYSTSYRLLHIALCLCLSGDFTYWCNGLKYGYWIFFAAFCLVALAYFMLVLCLAEINSCLPFSGNDADLLLLILDFYFLF
jgi:hypothetical protein